MWSQAQRLARVSFTPTMRSSYFPYFGDEETANGKQFCKSLSCKSPASRLAQSLAQSSCLAKIRQSEWLCAVFKDVFPNTIWLCPPLFMFCCEERVPVCNSKFWSLCWSWRHFSLSVAETATQKNCLFYRNKIVETGGSVSPELGHPCDSAFTKRTGEDVRCPPEGRTRMEWVYLLQTLSPLPGAGTHTCSDPTVTVKQPSTRPGVHKQPNLAYHPFLQNTCFVETQPHSFIWMFSMTPFMLQQCACMLSHSACPTRCDPMDCSLPRSSVHGILQARILGWGAILSSRGFSWPRDQTSVSYGSCIGRRIIYH